MEVVLKKISIVLGVWIIASVCASQVTAEDLDTLLHGGPPRSTVALPNPANIPIVFPRDLKWAGEDGEFKAPLFGDANKPGIYGILIRWEPGHNSQPHFHSTDRYIYVVSGNWWVSSSDKYDEKTMYPVPAGSFVTDIAKTVHWDGARGEPCLLMLVGMGPVVTTHLSEK